MDVDAGDVERLAESEASLLSELSELHINDDSDSSDASDSHDVSPRSEALGPLGSDERQQHEDTARWYRENFPPNSGAVLPCGSPSRGEAIEPSSTPLYPSESTARVTRL